MGEKEEASTLSHSFARFEDGFLISFDIWLEALFDVNI